MFIKHIFFLGCDIRNKDYKRLRTTGLMEDRKFSLLRGVESKLNNVCIIFISIGILFKRDGPRIEKTFI